MANLRFRESRALSFYSAALILLHYLIEERNISRKGRHERQGSTEEMLSSGMLGARRAEDFWASSQGHFTRA
jgi:hypothetical protein